MRRLWLPVAIWSFPPDRGAARFPSILPALGPPEPSAQFDPGWSTIQLSRRKRVALFRQSENSEFVCRHRCGGVAAARCDHRYVLAAVFAQVGARNRFSGRAQFDGPQFLARFGIEGAEARIIGSANEYQS